MFYYLFTTYIIFRPLSLEAIFYARSDTHYLLYVYDMIKKDLMAMSTTQCNYIELVFERSTEVCKTVINNFKYWLIFYL